jgi:hypothetical protein
MATILTLTRAKFKPIKQSKNNYEYQRHPNKNILHLVNDHCNYQHLYFSSPNKSNLK